MDAAARIEAALRGVMRRRREGAAPPRLADALDHAVFPGGARVRPQLCLAVAAACGDDAPALADAAAAAVELIHCASLAHDDLPCFDGADLRRGRASVHAAFGEPIALLAGDALIVAAFEALADGCAASAPAADRSGRLGGMVATLARFSGAPFGICAGQAWESEPSVDVAAYHQAKTGALFVAATRLGALSAGADPDRWEAMGARIGAAYQVADDLRDALLTEEELGKPAGQDQALARPSAVAELGVAGAARRLSEILEEAVAAIPDCRGAGALREIVRMQARRLTPSGLAEAAA
ncbi:polyprenyl synthetase family protein [Albimonas sp. CAU 1670]|uniref:polyprenyl synthetase family protein n=1 Tax=Albimonas sp. CAU 1670 TaxID=3032599 RepID=UPI0023D9CA43|nr:polyprenyl synthetase family protein [Albimonas sp. CAU 1670]MDF2231487.1 polyprenyl synthetase family protein [Albimonas sp. CAU 1670]